MVRCIERLNRTQKAKLKSRGSTVATDIQYEIPTWSQIYDLLLTQSEKIHNYKPDLIVGIARGGLIPARILTDLLETPQLATIDVEFYLGINQTRLKPELKQPLSASVNYKKILLVDDIADTGKSLQLAKSHLQDKDPLEIKIATLYLKPQSITKPDFYEKQTSNWVIFPWDTKETIRKIIQKQTGKRQANQEIAKLVKTGLPKHVADRLIKDMQ